MVVTMPLIQSGRLDPRCLEGEVVIVTGAGGGIGLEAARSLLHLGASVVTAELDAELCASGTALLTSEFTERRVLGLRADVGDADAVRDLVDRAMSRFGKIDAVINNATYAPAGSAVAETPIEDWDRSYAVNLRAPALLARACLPGMLERRHGVFVCVSSTGGPFLAPYESVKAAQVALSSSLDAELTGSGVAAFTIGPGLVPTPTAVAAIDRIAPRLGMTVEEFWRTNHGAVVSVEAAGAGFAAAIAMADRYGGQEISSTQALVDAGISVPEAGIGKPAKALSRNLEAASAACARVLRTLNEQSAGWQERSFFERQWMLRDFKQRVGVPVERCIETLSRLTSNLSEGAGDVGDGERLMLKKLGGFYAHLGELASGYVKDPAQRREQTAITERWTAEVQELERSLER